ncbi:MAG: hypothetical protein QF464_17260, partial [Myxococcota bacterium]|nr:hypothetical protein [Myxococcota bacterium]
IAVLMAAMWGCALEPTEQPTAPPSEHNDIVVYTELCKAALGIEDVTLPPMNCLDGVEIPLTVGGLPPDEATYEALTRGEIGCDSPSWFTGHDCENGSVIQTLDLSEDVEAILLCRMRSYTGLQTRQQRRIAYEEEPTLEAYRSLFTFDSVGMIWTHKETGVTCFFERTAELYGGYVAAPDDPSLPEAEDLPDPAPPSAFLSDEEQLAWWRRGAREAWAPPIVVTIAGRCIGCHDGGPFIRTPWLQDLEIVPPHDPGRPYRAVAAGADILVPPVAISTAALPGPDGLETPQICTGCHRIGAYRSCREAVPYYTATTVPPGLHDDGVSFRALARMPPPSDAWEALDDDALAHAWDEAFGAHVAMLQCCCDNPNALGCTKQDLRESPLATPVAGQGPASCLDVVR